MELFKKFGCAAAVRWGVMVRAGYLDDMQAP